MAEVIKRTDFRYDWHCREAARNISEILKFVVVEKIEVKFQLEFSRRLYIVLDNSVVLFIIFSVCLQAPIRPDQYCHLSVIFVDPAGA